MKKKVLLIGASSMLGSRLKLLLDREYIVYRCGRNKNDDIQFDLSKLHFNYDNLDLEVDNIIHCASTFSDDSLDGFLENEIANSISSIGIVKLAIKLKAKSITYTGTIFSENISPRKQSSYGISKKRAEELFTILCKKNNIKFLSLRFPQLIDDVGACSKNQPWFARMVLYSYTNTPLRMPQETGKANFLYIDDAISILLLCIKKKIEGIFPVYHPNNYSYFDIFNIAKKIFSSSATCQIDTKKSSIKHYPVDSSDNLYKEISYHPKFTVEDTIRKIKKQGTAKYFGNLDIK